MGFHSPKSPCKNRVSFVGINPLAYNRNGRHVCAVQLGQGDTRTAQGLWRQLGMFDLKHVRANHYPACRQIVPDYMHVETKSETAAIEMLNGRIRHYLARFRRKIF